MKKLLFAAMVLAGTALGFAKDNVKISNSIEKSFEKTEILNDVSNIFLQKPENVLAVCTDVVFATQMIKQKDGSWSEEVISSCENTYPCIEGGTTLHIIRLPNKQ
jgi:hypothetical protein